ncbi:Acetyltransferase (GNAT) family protein [Jatrophihabitans endophyticus]|uniref:Acetyltransferase (GNAT) family protein n=1 Tax=Jatrophihabitans endophyticus TaxID=1206085 RepID=A0A1M5PEL3_9ACTN|nr:GNAT family N-acetyltransferase [Jatrophihabitans endophyticus]SHH00185.1 Acetyltransferase (GNAT) family protein [Jatrophihabitans endophyticus]
MSISLRPVDAACFDDVQLVFGTRGQAARCQCQGYRLGWYDQHSDDVAGRRELLRDQVIEGHGLLAYLDDEPVGWCSLAPRRDYPYLRQTTWKGRSEDKDDPDVWAVTCFVTRAGCRKQGVARALAVGTVDVARDGGARTVEAYPMKPAPGKDVPWGEMHVGSLGMFLAAGYRVVHTPSLRRAVVRYDL